MAVVADFRSAMAAVDLCAVVTAATADLCSALKMLLFISGP